MNPMEEQQSTESPMTVSIKTEEELAKMRTAERLAAQVLEMIGRHVEPG